MRDTVARVAATAPDLSLDGFPGILTLLKTRANTTPKARLECIITLPLGKRPQLVVCLKSPAMHIRVIWGNQFVTPSFVRPTPEDEKVLTFVREFRMDQLPATVVILQEWLTQSKVEVLREADMEAA